MCLAAMRSRCQSFVARDFLTEALRGSRINLTITRKIKSRELLVSDRI